MIGKRGNAAPTKKAQVAPAASGKLNNAQLRELKLVNMHTVVPEELHRRIKIYSATYGITIRELLVEALEDRLKKGKA